MNNPVSQLIATVEKRNGNRGWLHNDNKPPAEFNTYFSLGTSRETLDELKIMADKKSIQEGRKVSKAELVRRYIEWGLENDK